MERTPEAIQEAQYNAEIATGVRKEGRKGVNCWQTNVMKQVELVETCMSRNCTSPATARIAVNIWGCVYEADVCEKHKDMHGKWIDDL